MNYFALNNAAERYAKGRPNFHSNSIAHVKQFLKLEDKLATALDIACGTGLSTTALCKIAKHVFGTDSSQEMLDFAIKNKAINYSVASAEKQPFNNHLFDLITVCSGVHWFNMEAFLAETNRLLKSKAWLVLYDNFFIAQIENNPSFKDWYERVYLNKFPAPPRNDQYSWTNENLQPFDFSLKNEAHFTNPISFTKQELVLYFTTQSNIIAAIEQNNITYKEVESWLENELSNFFENDKTIQIIYFGNWIKYLQKLK